MNKMKKLGSAFLACTLLFALMTGCGSKEEQEEEPTADVPAAEEQEEEPMRAVFLTDEDGNQLFVDLANETLFYGTIPEDIQDEEGIALAPEDMKNGDVYLIYGNQIMLESLPGQYPGITCLVRQEQENQELIAQYGSLLEQYTVKVDPSEPPYMNLAYRQETGLISQAIAQGGFTWSWVDENGKTQTVTTDSAHILQWGDLLTEITLEADTQMIMEFSYTPESVEVVRWTEDQRVDTTEALEEPKAESVRVESTEEGFAFAGQAGYAYRITGIWQEGTVEYGCVILG